LELRECLKQLQKEIFDIVNFKTEIYIKRQKAEFGAGQYDYESDEAIKSEIERIREDLFNLPFEEAGREIIDKFQANFEKLRAFMDQIDKEIGSYNLKN